MTKVFIGGSRRLTRLNAAIRHRMDRIIENGLLVLVGDANGADKAVQLYLKASGYGNVEVFCSNGACRNNLGNWPLRVVKAPGTAKSFEFYAAKDRQMAQESSIGFMLWDGNSKGTRANILRLLDQQKKVVVYFSMSREFLTLRSRRDWETLFLHRERSDPSKTKKSRSVIESKLSDSTQVALF